MEKIRTDRVSLCLCFVAFSLFWSSYFLMWQSNLMGNEVEHYSSRISEIVVCFVTALLIKRLFVQPKTLIIASIAFSFLRVLSASIPLVSGILSGLAAGLFVISALSVFSRFEMRTAQIGFILGTLTASLISILASFLPLDSFLLLRDSLMLIAPLLLLGSALLKEAGAIPNEIQEKEDPRTTSDTKFLVIGMTTFALLCGFASQVFILKGIELGLMNTLVELSSMVLLFMLLIAYLFLKGITLDTALLIILSIFAVATLGSSFFFSSQLINEGVFVRAGFDVYRVIIWLHFIRIAHKHFWRGYYYFALINGALRSCVLIGRLVGGWACASFGLDVISSLMFALIIIWLIALIIMLFIANIRQKQQSNLPALESDIESTQETSFENISNIYAKKINLSARETEILQHFVHGRSTSHIAKTLFISENTVKTHIRRIYFKAEVHSRQELLDNIEQCRNLDT